MAQNNTHNATRSPIQTKMANLGEFVRKGRQYMKRQRGPKLTKYNIENF